MNIDIEKERANFEAACRQHAKDAGYDDSERLERDGDGYADLHTQAAWWAWQARAVLQSQDREDAERYRWLRKHWFTMTSCYDGGRVEFTTGQPRYSSATGADVDEAIDHARRIEDKT